MRRLGDLEVGRMPARRNGKLRKDSAAQGRAAICPSDSRPEVVRHVTRRRPACSGPDWEQATKGTEKRFFPRFSAFSVPIIRDMYDPLSLDDLRLAHSGDSQALER